MKIHRLFVRGFGKIEDFSTALSDGLNVVYGPNESGKSTLMMFIKAMLYGLKGGRTGKDGAVPEVKKYMPLNNAPYGGYMNFELDNESTYRIDRAFDNGTVKLYDRSFNEITGSLSDNRDGNGIAEKLIGLSESLFERTVFIRQMGTRIENSASKELIDRIANIRQSGSEDISFKKAEEALKEALKQQVGTGRSHVRPLDIINRRLEGLTAERAAAQEEYKKIMEEKARQQELAVQIEKLTAKEKLFSSLLEFCKLKGTLKLQREKNEELRFLNEGIRQAQKNIDSMNKDKELLDREIDNKLQSQRTRSKVMNICIIFFLIGTIGAGFIKPLFAVVPLLITIVLSVFRIRNAGIGMPTVHAGEGQEAYDRRIDQILFLQAESLNTRIADQKTQYERLLKRLEDLEINFTQVDIAASENEIDALSKDIFNHKHTANLSQAEEELIERIIEEYSDSHLMKAADLKEALAGQLLKKRLEYASLNAAAEKNEKTGNADIIESEIARLTQQKRGLEQRGEALNIAIRTLEESADHVQKKYIPVMNKVFNSTFSGLTGGKYSDVRAGDNLNIMVNDPLNDTIFPVSMLSDGAIDQIYLALRLAISETVLKMNERLPFIMDEPFSQFDDERTENALKYICEISRKQQVVIFTCKKREVELISSRCPCKICSLT